MFRPIKIRLILLSLISLCLSACTIWPGQYEITKAQNDINKLPPAKAVEITPALIQELLVQDQERKAQINKDQMLTEQLLANTVLCTPDTKKSSAIQSGKSAHQRSRLKAECDSKASKPLFYEYKMGVGDVLRINVWGNPDFNLFGTSGGGAGTSLSGSSITNAPPAQAAGRNIEENGKLYFPLIGNTQAAGLTVSVFRQQLIKALSAFIKDPQVDVSVMTYRSQRIYLNGEIKVPGVYPITDIPLRITDLIGTAGGTTQESDLTNVTLLRDNKNYTLDLYDLYYEGRSGENVMLKHGDIINIGDRQARKVFVMGEVLRPGSTVMRRGKISLTEAIMDAGGLNQLSAASGRVYILRADESGSPVIYQLDASQPQAMVIANKFILKPQDYVFVNPTDITMIGRIIAQLFPTYQPIFNAKSAGLIY